MSDATLDRFRVLVREFAAHHEFIARAQRLSSRYSPEVVDRVIRDHRLEADLLLPELVTHFAEVDAAWQEVAAAHDAGREERDALGLSIQALELRALIGELDELTAARRALPFRARLAELEPRLEAEAAACAAYEEVLQEWQRVGVAAGVLRPRHTDRRAA